MVDFSSAHIATAQPGKPAYINDAEWQYCAPRGHVAVFDDGKTYFYRVSRLERGAFKEWVRDVFGGVNCRKIRGAWPIYSVGS